MLYKSLIAILLFGFNFFSFSTLHPLMNSVTKAVDSKANNEESDGASSKMPIYKIICQPERNNLETNFAKLGNSDASSHISEIVAMAWTSSGDPLTARGSLVFNFSAIPKNAKITSAKLSLYSNRTPLNGNHSTANYGYDNSFYIYRNMSPWDENTEWADQPNVEVGSQILVPHTAYDFLDVVNVEVKKMVQSMRVNGNYGFKLQLAAERIYTIRNFASSLHKDASRHPKLVVYYQLP